MADIITRETSIDAKGAPLTNTELDSNFINLNTDKAEYLKPSDITADVTAVVDGYLSITCSTVDITVTLPVATASAGKSIYIHKVDSTEFKVIVTGVKDILYQDSVMHLVSNGIKWVIS